MSATLILIGDQLGLYKALARQPMNASELAAATGTSKRYMREWLGNQAAGGYVDYDADADRYALSPEQALCMAARSEERRVGEEGVSPCDLLGSPDHKTKK